MRRIKIFDTTLRDGEQSPGIALRPEEKAEIALTLERLGVDVIEAGFAAASPGDFEGVTAAATAVSIGDRRVAGPDERRGHRRRRRLASPRATGPRARVHRDQRAAHGAQARPRARRGARAHRLVRRLRGGTVRRGRVLGRGRDAVRPRRFSRRLCRAAVAAGAADRQPARHGRLCLAGRVRGPVPRSGARAVPSSRPSRSRCTATTTSAWRSRTRSPASERARRRSSARSTASASARATHRSKRS